MATAAELQITIRGDASQVNRTLDGLSRSLGGVRQDAQQTHAGFVALSGAFAAGQVAATAFMGVLSSLGGLLVENVRAAFDYNATLAAQTTAYESLLGSADAAQSAIADLVNFANRTPFDTATVVDFGQKLLSAGQSAESLIPTMTAVGNIAAQSGQMTSEAMGRVALALSQVASAGKLQGDELNQLSEAGVNALQAIQEAYGLTRAEVVKLKEAGGITSDMLIYSLQKMGLEGAKFAGGMSKQLETAGGALETLTSNLETARARVFKPLTDAMGDLVIAVAKFTNSAEFERGLRIITGLVAGLTKILKTETIPALQQMGLAGKEAATTNAGFFANLGVGLIAFTHGAAGAVEMITSITRAMISGAIEGAGALADLYAIVDAFGRSRTKKDESILTDQFNKSMASLSARSQRFAQAGREGLSGTLSGWSNILGAQNSTLQEMLTVRQAIVDALNAPAGAETPTSGPGPKPPPGADTAATDALAKYQDSLRKSLEKEVELRGDATDREAELRAAFYDKIGKMDADYLATLRAARQREEDVEESHLERMTNLRAAYNADRKKGEARLAEIVGLQAVGSPTREEADKLQAEREQIQRDLKAQAANLAAQEEREKKYQSLIDAVATARSPEEVNALEDQIRGMMKAERDAARARGEDVSTLRDYQREITDLFDIEQRRRLETFGYLTERKRLETDTNKTILEGYAAELKALKDIAEARAALKDPRLSATGTMVAAAAGSTIVINEATFEGPAAGETWPAYMERMMAPIRAQYNAEQAARR